MTKDVSQRAVEYIKEEAIIPKAKIFAVVQKISFWIAVALALALGSFAAAAIIFIMTNSDWDLVGKLGGRFILRSMPYLWFIFLGFFVLVADLSYGKTTFGHRTSLLKITIIYVFLTLIIGALLTFAGMDRVFEKSVSGRGFMYRMMNNQKDVWTNPAQGILSGSIREVTSSSILLTDFNGSPWTIDTRETLIRGRAVLSPGQMVKVLGVATGSNFQADEIRPWVGGGMMGGGGPGGARSGYGGPSRGMMR